MSKLPKMNSSEAESMPETMVWPLRPYAIHELASVDLDAPLAPEVLCQIGYGTASGDADPRRVMTPLQPLANARGGECWISPTPVRSGRIGRFGYAENDEVIMLNVHVAEAAMPRLEDAVHGVYRELLELIAARGYLHLLRVWNYLSDINQGSGDAERYRRFCLGRFAAISGRPGFEAQLPAASAIGSRGGEGLTLIALAGKHAGLQIENPRQLSAFKYPRVYGERSPSFSRATLQPWADGAELLVSGTASIVGHATLHAGDPVAQLEQTAVNLEALRAHATQRSLPAGAPIGALRAHSYVLYLRDAGDWPLLKPSVERCFGDAPMRVLIGDICRSELLVEVEAIYRSTTAPARAC